MTSPHPEASAVPSATASTEAGTETRTGPHAAPRKRRHWIGRVVLLGVVLPASIVAWQAIAVRPVADEVDALNSLDSESGIGILNRAIRDSSPTMVAFFDSTDFDAYAEWFAAHDPDEVALQQRYTDKCDTARTQVWMPPFAGTVRKDCDTLRDASLDQRRGVAFGPVLIEYVRRCASGEDNPIRQDNPYTDEQWRAMTVVIDEALDADCGAGVPIEDENLQNA